MKWNDYFGHTIKLTLSQSGHKEWVQWDVRTKCVQALWEVLLFTVSSCLCRRRSQELYFLWFLLGQNFVVHRITCSSLLFFCRTELITPIRHCSVNTELIHRMNKQFGTSVLCSTNLSRSEWMFYPSFASRFHDSRHWYFWTQDDQFLWIAVPLCWL